MDLRPGESGETSNQPDKWEKLFSSMGLNSQPLLPHSFSLPVPWNGRVCAGPRVPGMVLSFFLRKRSDLQRACYDVCNFRFVG